MSEELIKRCARLVAENTRLSAERDKMDIAAGMYSLQVDELKAKSKILEDALEFYADNNSKDYQLLPRASIN